MFVRSYNTALSYLPQIHLVALLVCVGYLLLPGYLLLYALRVYRHRFLFSYSISLCLLVVTQIPIRWFGGSLVQWILLLNGAIVVLFVTGLSLSLSRKTRLAVRRRNTRITTNRYFVLTILLFGVYHGFVGPYTEIPSDFWKHLARVQFVLNNNGYQLLDTSNSGYRDYLFSANYIYTLYAYLSRILNTNLLILAPTTTLVTGSIFMCTIYWFSIRIFSGYRLFSSTKALIGFLAAILTLFIFGTATFSFVRYYSFFPSIFALPLFYTSIVVFLDYLEKENVKYKTLLLLPLFFIVMLLVHRQEALFLLILVFGISTWKAVQTYSKNCPIPRNLKMRARIFSGLSISFFLLVSLYIITQSELKQWGHTPHVIDLGTYFPWLKGIPIANPSFRFWDTLTVTGVLVYLWYFAQHKKFLSNSYVFVGMLSPLFTIFNPIYSYLFLHVGNSTGLWRTAYLMPLAIVSSFLIVTSLKIALTDGKPQRIFFPIIAASLLLSSLFPFRIPYLFNDNSKLPSLLPVENRYGRLLWFDLIDSVSSLQKKHNIRNILTDQTTHFVLYAATRGEIWPWINGNYFPKRNYDYQTDILESDFNNHLLIVNRRDGSISGSSKYSDHWEKDILIVSRYYPNDIDTFIEKYPDRFTLLWERDRIQIFLIRNPPD